MKLNKLTREEQRVIIEKGTEAPHSGEYDSFLQEGMYVCRRCGAFLYRSEDKFDAHCGWPSFDDTVLGAVKSSVDADGRRTEITCERCDAHLGHVFIGEKMTPKNTRHCVNSLSMRFVSKVETAKKHSFAYFGSGCFWCSEATFKMIRGVISVVPGYAGGTEMGDDKVVTYKKVSTGKTGHAEVIRIEYDSSTISYEGLLNVFFAAHDPTTLNRQGNDTGTQYRSIILYSTELEKEISEKMINSLDQEKVFEDKIVTEIKQLGEFYEAEAYHHDYFDKNPNTAYCQAIIAPKLVKLRNNVKKYLK